MDPLPIEMFREILSYLSFDELLKVSLVCRAWFDATEPAIIGSGMFRVTDGKLRAAGGKIANPMRKYRSIGVFVSGSGRALLHKVVPVFPCATELFLDCDTIAWVDTVAQVWPEKFESLHISLNDLDGDEFDFPENATRHTFKFPNLKVLAWRQYDYENVVVTVVAPKLETLGWQSWSFTAKVLFRHCSQLKLVNFGFCEKDFTATFPESMDNLETLQLRVERDFCDVSFLRDLHRLRFLNMEFTCEKSLLPVIGDLNKCTQLKTLKISFSKANLHKDTLNLQSLLDNLPTIEVLELKLVNLKTTDCATSTALKELSLIEVTYQEPTLTLTAPNLRKLTVPLIIMGQVQLPNSPKLDRLNVYLGLKKPREPFEKTIHPFLPPRGSVRKLALIHPERRQLGHDPIDPKEHDYIGRYLCRAFPPVQLLELHWMNLSVDFFRRISECDSFQNFKLAHCVITCAGLRDNEQIHLPAVRRLELDEVGLRMARRTDNLPVTVGGPTIRRDRPHPNRADVMAFFSDDEDEYA